MYYRTKNTLLFISEIFTWLNAILHIFQYHDIHSSSRNQRRCMVGEGKKDHLLFRQTILWHISCPHDSHIRCCQDFPRAMERTSRCLILSHQRVIVIHLQYNFELSGWYHYIKSHTEFTCTAEGKKGITIISKKQFLSFQTIQIYRKKLLFSVGNTSKQERKKVTRKSSHLFHI